VTGPEKNGSTEKTAKNDDDLKKLAYIVIVLMVVATILWWPGVRVYPLYSGSVIPTFGQYCPGIAR